MVAIAIAAAAGWLALFWGCAAVTSDRRLRSRMRRFRAARRSGRPLPGAGETAWLINQGRTAVVQAEGKTVKLTVRGGSAQVPPGAVTRLAAIVADRLAERSEIA